MTLKAFSFPVRNETFTILHKNVVKISLSQIDREHFLIFYPREDKWEAFRRIRSEWIKRYGTIDGYQIVNGRKITFIGKMKWAFDFIDAKWPEKKKQSRLISWFKKILKIA